MAKKTTTKAATTSTKKDPAAARQTATKHAKATSSRTKAKPAVVEADAELETPASPPVTKAKANRSTRKQAAQDICVTTSKADVARRALDRIATKLNNWPPRLTPSYKSARRRPLALSRFPLSICGSGGSITMSTCAVPPCRRFAVIGRRVR
ncbi:hypothetical protein [Lignipirellula cremea]|uniref:Uncharacterized protein n=1 Tax=Lignipirellula cremea TaxID=2528010 RepID=A0A518E481_9BACT|nr:hypothetical protein [Lignipirellula cremea]QDU98904.1 hypothetical protein Pla8534_68150 [Lignipirellula cremea]